MLANVLDLEFIKVFLKVKQGSLMAVFQGCYIIESCRRTVPRILLILPRTKSFIQRIFKDTMGVSSVILKHPQSYVHIPEPLNKSAEFEGGTFAMMNTCTLARLFHYLFSEC